MTHSTSTLFDRYDRSGLALGNRAVLAPMTRISADEDGRANERMRDYYSRFAAGGFGAIVTEGSYVDSAHSQTYLGQPGLARAEHVPAWRQVTAAVHEHGAAVIAQLQHSGPQGQGNVHVTGLRAPSAVRARGEQAAMYRGTGPYALPEAMTVTEVEAVIRAFADAAARAQDAGFDGVEVHGANGYLVDAFLTDYLNRRADGYGGPPAARVRFACEVIDRIRDAVGAGFVVGIRISQGKVSDPHHRWAGGVEEAGVVFGALASTSVDYIHTTEWRAADPAFPEADPRSLAALARGSAPGVTIIANGHIDTLDDADELLATGDADLVAIGKSALANRDWPLAVRAGRALEPRMEPTVFGELATIQDWEVTR